MKTHRKQRKGLSSPEGWQKVAGGRSEAQTTGTHMRMIPTLTGSQKVLHPSGVRTNYSLVSGGLRFASTTGYSLSALQAESGR